MKEDSRVKYKIEEMRSENCRNFMSLHTKMIKNIEEAVKSGESKKISIFNNMEQITFNLFKEIDKCQNELLRKVGVNELSNNIVLTSVKGSKKKEEDIVKEYKEDYSLEKLKMNRYEVYIKELPLEKNKNYKICTKGTVLVFGHCNKEIELWIKTKGLTVKRVPNDVFDEEMESYYDKSIVGAIGIPRKGWSEEECYNYVKQMYFSAKYMAVTWYKNKIKPFFVVVTKLGGSFGIKSSDKEFVTGSLSGLCKTAAREWMKNVSTHYIDVDSSISNKQLIKCIENEIIYGTEVEVGYSKTLERRGLRLKESYESKLDSKKPSINDVFLVSGGGRGITSICITEMAKRFQCKFIIIGRTKFVENFVDIYEGLDVEEIRKLIIKEKQSAKEKIKYAEADKIAREFVNQRQIHNTLRELKRAGSKVLYFSCDVRDDAKLKKVVKEGTKVLGKITGVIHGAGVLKDRLLNKKTEEEFEEVFGIKYYGINNMIKEAGIDNLKYIFVYSSIAGFFGNFGQSDYSCGNEYLNHFVRYWKNVKPSCKVMAINWGPWNAGMPDKALKVAMIRRGKTLVEPEEGRLFFVDAFAKQWGENQSQIIINDVNGLGGSL